MSDDALKTLSRAAGLHIDWTDASGRPQKVKPDTQRAVLAALRLPADTPKQIIESTAALESAAKAVPRLIAALGGQTVHAGSAKRIKLRHAGGPWKDAALSPLKTGGMSFRAPEAIGYYELEIDGAPHTLAVAPPRCYGSSDIARGEKLSGIGVQIYSLRGGCSEGFGDFAALGQFAAGAGRAGIDALAVSPTHAGFSADAARFSPYAPSTRFFIDPLYCDLSLFGAVDTPQDNGAQLIDWRAAHAKKFERLRAAYRNFAERSDKQAFWSFCEKEGQPLRDHAAFEALDAYFRTEGITWCHRWPAEFRNPQSRAVKEFCEREASEIEFHLFLQWLAAWSAESAQGRAKEKMAIGIIVDIAVGLDRYGSHAWSKPDDLLAGLNVGAPSDAFNANGQDWGLTTFSPASLRASGYGSFIETIRTAMRHAGGIRIDHAMGLRRLWVLPSGAVPGEGVYLNYPMQDLIRLIALESHLNRAIVMGEDLGTVPEGFRAQLAAAGILGMRVLWFERGSEGRFTPPEQWDFHAAALTTTHDLPTVAGWWQGRDLVWRAKLDRKSRPRNGTAEQRARKQDRSQLWSALVRSRCVKGKEPMPENPEPVLDGVLCHIGKAASVLAIAAAEDMIEDIEQPNLPGTTDEHPNWRRRLPAKDFWSDPKIKARFARFAVRQR